MLLTDFSESLELTYHETLNPKLWTKDSLKENVKKSLINIAKAFCKKLNIPENKIIDIALTGSNANYNWSKQSDIDLHVIVDYKEDECNSINVDDCLNAQKSLWNEDHDIDIKGINVEVYVQLKDEKFSGNAGIYSIMKNKWTRTPTKVDIKYDEKQIKQKATPIEKDIDSLIKNKGTSEEAEKLKYRIRKMRKTGINKNGEFSLENLTFKHLRYNGYLEKLSDYYKKAIDSELSLK